MLLHYLGKADQAKCVKINRKPEKNPDITDRNLNKDQQQILIIFSKKYF